MLAGRYRLAEPLGCGWEGEVYRVAELRTGISRAAKVFYPERNPGNRTARFHARKLERLRHCPILIQYHHSEEVEVGERKATCLISDLVEGEPLTELTERHAGRRLPTFEALHLLRALAVGVECIHQTGEYHGDLHAGNIVVRRRGVHFDLRVLDFFHRGRISRENRQMDIVDMVRIFYDAVGGPERYASQPPEVKTICRGLRVGLILERFPTAERLRRHLESFGWQ